AHAPVGPAAVALVPVGADAGLAGPAVVEEDSGLTDLGPFHRVLPFARVEAAPADIVLNRLGWVLALEVLYLAIEDDVVLLVHLLDAEDHDVGRFMDDPAEGVGGLDIRVAGLRRISEQESGGDYRYTAEQARMVFHDWFLPFSDSFRRDHPGAACGWFVD